MKKCILLAVIVALAAFASRSNAQKPDDYPLSVHVSGSSVVWGGAYEEQIEATIDGKKIKLRGQLTVKHMRLVGTVILLKPGDYKAKVVKENNYNAWEYSREYEILLPDGTRERLFAAGESEN